MAGIFMIRCLLELLNGLGGGSWPMGAWPRAAGALAHGPAVGAEDRGERGRGFLIFGCFPARCDGFDSGAGR